MNDVIEYCFYHVSKLNWFIIQILNVYFLSKVNMLNHCALAQNNKLFKTEIEKSGLKFWLFFLHSWLVHFWTWIEQNDFCLGLKKTNDEFMVTLKMWKPLHWITVLNYYFVKNMLRRIAHHWFYAFCHLKKVSFHSSSHMLGDLFNNFPKWLSKTKIIILCYDHETSKTSSNAIIKQAEVMKSIFVIVSPLFPFNIHFSIAHYGKVP